MLSYIIKLLLLMLFTVTARAAVTPDFVVQDSVNKATYLYSSGTASLAPAAAATDIIVIKGSATKTVRVNSFVVCPSATAAGAQTMWLVKRSTANTAGTSAASTGVQIDSSDVAPSSTAVTYSANPTGLGTAVWTLPRRIFFQITAGTTVIEPCYDLLKLSQDTVFAKPVVLRGATESLALNNNAAALAAGYTINSWYAIVTEE